MSEIEMDGFDEEDLDIEEKEFNIDNWDAEEVEPDMIIKGRGSYNVKALEEIMDKYEGLAIPFQNIIDAVGLNDFKHMRSYLRTRFILVRKIKDNEEKVVLERMSQDQIDAIKAKQKERTKKAKQKK